MLIREPQKLKDSFFSSSCIGQEHQALMGIFPGTNHQDLSRDRFAWLSLGYAIELHQTQYDVFAVSNFSTLSLSLLSKLGFIDRNITREHVVFELYGMKRGQLQSLLHFVHIIGIQFQVTIRPISRLLLIEIFQEKIEVLWRSLSKLFSCLKKLI